MCATPTRLGHEWGRFCGTLEEEPRLEEGRGSAFERAPPPLRAQNTWKCQLFYFVLFYFGVRALTPDRFVDGSEHFLKGQVLFSCETPQYTIHRLRTQVWAEYTLASATQIPPAKNYYQYVPVLRSNYYYYSMLILLIPLIKWNMWIVTPPGMVGGNRIPIPVCYHVT